MEQGSYFIRGLLIGLIFGVPAGIIGILTIKRTIEYGFFAGVVTGFGSAAADLIYGFIGVCGLTAVSDILLSRERLIRIFGGILISLYGFMTLWKAVQKRKKRESLKEKPEYLEGTGYSGGYPLLFASSFLIAITNPATILAFVTAFASFGILGGVRAGQGGCLLLGLAGGTCFWWISLAGLTSLFRGKVSGNTDAVLNEILGGLMVLFGMGIIAGSL